MNYDLLFAIIFYVFLFIYYITHRERFEVQGKIFALYKTKIGINLMQKIANISPKFFKVLGLISIGIGFAGMIFIFYILIQGTFSLIFVPDAQPVIAPVLPGIKIPGLPRLSFWYWIISILVVATIHEFSHGIFSKANKVRVKSSGFAFLGPILAAFVEPDEKELKKSSKFAQLSIFSAGPFSNIVTGAIIFLIAGFIVTPFAISLVDFQGVEIVSLDENYPAASSGLEVGEIIVSVNDIPIENTEEFRESLKDLKPDDKVKISTQGGKEVSVIASENPDIPERGYLGIVSGNKAEIKESITERYGNFLVSAFFWFVRLLEWIFLISFGIALANLLPLGPVDGGRMSVVAIGLFTKNEKKQQKIWLMITLFVLALIVINLLPYLQRLLVFIFNPIFALF